MIICGDCLEVLPTLPKAKMIFADPPDNLGMKYEGFLDKWTDERCYWQFLHDVVDTALKQSDIFWLSYNAKYKAVMGVKQFQMENAVKTHTTKEVVWHYTFGQNSQTDLTRSYRPILRFVKRGAKVYPDAIREPSARQTKYNDKRANPKGRVPDDVWEFPRVCGTFKERKKWHPCQHPKALLRRIVLFSTKPGDLVIDMFAGSGNMLEVCRELDRECIGIEISRFYCEKIAEEQGFEVTEQKAGQAE